MTDSGAATPQLLRRVNAMAVLTHLRGTQEATATELMAASGLTRASVIAVSEDLVRRGWITEVVASGAALGAGRPARRFELNAMAGVVVGVDIGAATTTASVADLRGTILGTASRSCRDTQIVAAERISVIDTVCLAALDDAGSTAASVLAVTAGLAAPVSDDGTLLASQPFWRQFDVGLRSALHDLHGWRVLLENDANLAALGERWRGTGTGVDHLVVLLASERLGAGIIESGRLLHGARGAAGEMSFLELVEGVGSTAGIAALVREWAPVPGTEPAEVFAAAARGDCASAAVLARIAERMARVITALSSLLNPEQLVLGGAVAESAGVLLPAMTARLAELSPTPPRVTVSALGDGIVTVGAVRHALDFVETHTLDVRLPATPPA